MEQNQSDSDANKQSGKAQHARRRKRQFYKRIRQQMEFYFGDSNLSKDRYLNKLINLNPYVPLEVFLKFNKIKETTTSIEDIQKAVKSSEMLELSEDKQSVRRITEVRTKEDLDEYMVYVEAIPPSATHETVRQQFKQFGNIAYISLPRYRTSGRIKEFAFIEFEEKGSVAKCINAFRQFDGVIGDTQEPENLKSVVAYVKEQEDLEKVEQEQKETSVQPKSEEKAEDKEKTVPESDESIKTEKKIENVKCGGASVVNYDEPQPSTSYAHLQESTKKRSNTETDEVPLAKRFKTQESIEAEESEDQLDKEALGNTTDEKASVTDENPDHKQNKRRRRKRHHSHSITNIESIHGAVSVHEDAKNGDEPTQPLTSLRVATKTEWKRLRNVYLNLQRQKYSEVKKLLQYNRNGDGKKVSTLPLSKVRPVTIKAKSLQSPAKRICTRNINFYGANREEHNANTYECSIVDENKIENNGKKMGDKTDKKPFGKDVQFEFEPGLIVKVNFDEPCTDVTDFKAEMKQYPFVRYVDIKEGELHAYVRVDVVRSAPTLIKHCAPNRCQILTGESETEYWAKIAKDREQKLSKSVKIPRNRSRKIRNIIKNIAEINVVKTDNKMCVTHIRFDDD